MTLRSTVGALGVGEVSLQEFGEASTVLIRIQRQDGGPQCVAGAQRVMQKRAGAGWQAKPGAAGDRRRASLRRRPRSTAPAGATR